MSTDGITIATEQRQVATVRVITIHITLHQEMDECFIVRIIAGNSAGMSSPTEITDGELIPMDLVLQ